MIRVLWVAAVVSSLGVGAVRAQDTATEADLRYALQADPDGGIWVVDQVKGLVSRCMPDAERAPRVVDIDFGAPVPRARSGAGAQPICTDWAAVERGARVAPKIIGAAGDLAGGTFSGQ